MNVYDFLAQLRTLDIQIAADDGKLRINAPKGSVTPEIRSEISARKAEILAVISDVEQLRIERQEGELPLSLAQEHLWQLSRLTPDTLAYNMHAVFRLFGPLSVDALEAAIAQVVERHAILRASFPKTVDNQPEQKIDSSSSVGLHRIVACPDIQAEELNSIITKEIRHPFDLSEGPLFRPTLVQIDANEHVFIIAMHHIISDGQSFSILLKDLARAYHAACEGMDVEWEPLPLQYVDFAAWQRQWLSSPASAADRSFWQDQLSGDVPALELPLDHPHPLQPVADGDYINLPLEGLSATLHDLCRREGVTLFAVATTAFYTLLHRHSGQRDLLVCTPVAGRDRFEFSNLVGYFNNTLLLRADLTKASTLKELLRQTQANVMNALAHQMFPFKEVANFPSLVRTPLSRAMVVVQNADDISLQLPNLTVEKINVSSQAMQYDLSLEITVAADQIGGRLMYRKVLFEKDTISKLANELVGILREMLSNKDAALSTDDAELTSGRIAQPQVDRPAYIAPRIDLERRLAEIWQEVLGIERIGVHDGFFELGGHSLLALRLFTRIEQETGTNLPLSILFGTTTIARLAQLINGQFTNDAWECLVPIQPRGTKPPFFCVHGIGGGVLGYRDLANFIGRDQPFYGLQAFGQDGSGDSDTSIEAMASRYIDVMRSHQPNGPYRIGGYCFGGVVAYEMARQLEKVGEQVSVLAIFEGAMPDPVETRNSILDRVRAIWSNLPSWTMDYTRMSPRQMLSRFRALLEKILIRLRGTPEVRQRARVEETLDINVEDLTQRNVEMTDLQITAALSYVPGPYSGEVALFRARHRSVNEILFGSLDPTMGWGRLVNGVKVVLVDGFHRNMHLAPYAESLARELKKELDRES